ncbi:MAG TPA: response regulator [Acetobacteraceae bacterium]|nr:response regulator [Acetobacteraceae bacterium]
MPTAAEAEIRAERVAAVLRQTPIAVAVTAVNASLMVAVTWTAVGGTREIAWLAAVVGVGAARLALWQAYRHDPVAAERAGRWAAAAMVSTAAAGLLWGGGGAWLWPASEAVQMFWVFVVGGMCAGAAALHYAHLPTVLAFILPAGLPIAAQFALDGSARGLAAAAMIAVFLTALTLTARRSSALFGNYVQLRLDAARRARELDAANAQLRWEMDERRAAEAGLRQAQKMEAVGQLTGGIAHDFNNLLMAVLGSLALLRKRLPPDDARAARLLETATEGANRGAALTQRLLAFSRRQALRPESVELPALIRGMSNLIERSVGPGYPLRARFPDRLPPVQADTNQLELALLNLVVNARDAMPEGGEIEVAAAEREVGPAEEAGLVPGHYVVLTVADRGIGMDEATLARAAEPFFTTKGVGRGTGLGLSMVHGLATQSGGRLALRSASGAGTVAELWLPRAEASPSPPPAVQAPASGPGRSLTVLVVDDDPLVLASTAALLEEVGHRTVEAEDGARALERVRAGALVDLVITDYGMPGMTGVEFAEELRRLRPGLPVLLATGYGELPAVDAAGLARLSKPFGQAALAAAVEAVLGRAEGARVRT